MWNVLISDTNPTILLPVEEAIPEGYTAEAITSNPNYLTDSINNLTSARVLTKYQFRKLFTFNERVAIDSAPTNVNIPAAYRAALSTIQKDMDSSGMVELDNSDTAEGLGFLTQLGLLASGRMYQILANTPPT